MTDDTNVKVGEMGYGFLKAFLHEKAEDIKKFLTRNKIGFIPEGIDYSSLQEVKNKTVFKQLKFLIGNHSTLSIIMIGLSMTSLDKDIKARIVEKNRNSIYNLHKGEGVSLLNLATTGFIEGYIKWLSDYNIRNNPSQKELTDIYEKNLKDWSERTIFVQNNMDVSTVSTKIINKINTGKNTFFVFASKSAIDITENAINDLKDRLKNESYEYSTDKLNNNEDERVWIFEKIFSSSTQPTQP